MKKIISSSLKICILLIMCFLHSTSNAQDLKQHRWKDRVIIIKTLDDTSAIYKKQLKAFSNAENDFVERKLVLYTIHKDRFTLANFKDRALDDSGILSKKVATTILNKNKKFEVILIGLDGGIKRKQTEVLTKEELFNTIDAMPMRRYEIKH